MESLGLYKDPKEAMYFLLKEFDVAHWLRGLSKYQLFAANRLNNAIRDDHLQGTTHRVFRCLVQLGIYPIVSSRKLQKIIEMCRENSLAFLFFLCEAYYKTDQPAYSLNEQILWSAIYNLDLRVTLRELNRILPPPQRPKENKSKILEYYQKHHKGKLYEQINYEKLLQKRQRFMQICYAKIKAARKHKYNRTYFKKLECPKHYDTKCIKLKNPPVTMKLDLGENFENHPYRELKKPCWFENYKIDTLNMASRRIVREEVNALIDHLTFPDKDTLKSGHAKVDNDVNLCYNHRVAKAIEERLGQALLVIARDFTLCRHNELEKEERQKRIREKLLEDAQAYIKDFRKMCNRQINVVNALILPGENCQQCKQNVVVPQKNSQTKFIVGEEGNVLSLSKDPKNVKVSIITQKPKTIESRKKPRLTTHVAKCDLLSKAFKYSGLSKNPRIHRLIRTDAEKFSIEKIIQFYDNRLNSLIPKDHKKNCNYCTREQLGDRNRNSSVATRGKGLENVIQFRLPPRRETFRRKSHKKHATIEQTTLDKELRNEQIQKEAVNFGNPTAGRVCQLHKTAANASSGHQGSCLHAEKHNILPTNCKTCNRRKRRETAAGINCVCGLHLQSKDKNALTADTEDEADNYFTINKSHIPYRFNYDRIFDFNTVYTHNNIEHKVRRITYEKLKSETRVSATATRTVLRHKYDFSGIIRRYASWIFKKQAMEKASLPAELTTVPKQESKAFIDFNMQYYDPNDKTLMDEMLKGAFNILKKNNRFVLASLPDAHKTPILREWIAKRYGKTYNKNDVWQLSLKTAREYQTIEKLLLKTPQENVLAFTNEFPLKRVGGHSWLEAGRRLKGNYFKKVDQSVMDYAQMIWYAMRIHAHTGKSPRNTVFTYLPTRRYQHLYK